MKKILSIISFFIFLFILSSCTIFIKTPNDNEFEYEKDTELITEDLNPDSFDHYETSNVSFNTLTYKSVYNSQSGDVMPQSGNINLLVLPIEISDYPFEDNYKEKLDKVLNGNGKDDTNYWESLKSFYEKSSYGNIKLNCFIADKYQSNYTALGLARLSKNKSKSSIKMLDKAYNNFLDINGSDALLQFDSEHDGLIDAVICVYSAPSVIDNDYIEMLDPNNDLFWAYQNNATTYNEKDINCPMYCNYLWISMYFFYFDLNNKDILDAHTVIHETGHLFGLDDYYSYNDLRSPCGSFDMMDSNIGDHSSLAKLSLGWVNPIYAYGKSKITLHDFESTGECILISDNWNHTAFDEYILIELYTPSGLNKLDSENAYKNFMPLYSEAGVKIWHVDNRLIRLIGNEYSYVVKEPEKLNHKYSYEVGQTNSSNDITQDDFDLIRLIECNTNILEAESYYTYKGFATNDSLWKSSSFTLEGKKEFFPNKTRLNNGNKLNYKVIIENFNNDNCEILIEKI